MGANFRKLEAFTCCEDLVVMTYDVARSLPADERFGLASQMRRAAVSAMANIAEGFGRSSRREKRRFLEISLGSLNELESYLSVSIRLELLGATELKPIRAKQSRAAGLVTGLMKALRHR